VKLTALRPNNPVAVMAAYGALRLLPGARLRWEGPHPELEWDGNPIDQLARLLPDRIQCPEVTLLDDVGESPDLIGRIPSEWLIAYAGQCAPRQVAGKGRKARMLPKGWTPTDLLLMGGRHQFVANAREIMAALSKRDIHAKIEEALVGPWRYEDRGQQAWGWDASARIDASSSPKAVTNSPKFGVLGAYWLAWESLPFWPMVNGCTVGMGRVHWIYPTCAAWLGAEGMRSLILGAAAMEEREAAALAVTLWRSGRISSSDYGGVLGWATPVSARTISERRNTGRFADLETPEVLIV
jgi:hypothetical protein